MKSLAVSLACACALLAAEPPQLTPEQQDRAVRLEKSLLAPCCWAEPVYRHNSSTAAEIKLDIANQIAAGKTDREILDGYIAQYGQRILVEPEGAKWWWMHVVPVAAAVLGLIFVIWLLARWRRNVEPAMPAS
jgi:cytochrome c-type biogenesis protein CcmH